MKKELNYILTLLIIFFIINNSLSNSIITSQHNNNNNNINTININNNNICDEGSITTTCIIYSEKKLPNSQTNLNFHNLILNNTLFCEDFKCKIKITSTSLSLFSNGSILCSNLQINSNKINISLNSKISTNGRGYSHDNGPGRGFKFENSKSGGGGYGGFGGIGESKPGAPYGSFKYPNQYGSGGGGNKGGSGGGVVNITSNYLFLEGTISADGNDGEGDGDGGGSGGSIFINSLIIEGKGKISSNGGKGVLKSGSGSGGRIHINTNSNFDKLKKYSISFKGGGSGGTIYLEKQDKLIFDQNIFGDSDIGASLSINDFQPSIIEIKGFSIVTSNINENFLQLKTNKLIIHSSGKIKCEKKHNCDKIVLNFNDTIIDGDIIADDLIEINGNNMNSIQGRIISKEIQINILNDIIFKEDGEISSDRTISKPGIGKGQDCLNGGAGGAGYGSYGGDGSCGKGGIPYGDIYNPWSDGSRGGNGGKYKGGLGGGKINITATNIIMDFSSISSYGEYTNNLAGGGSGGTILVKAKAIKGFGNIGAGDDYDFQEIRKNKGGDGAVGRVKLDVEYLDQQVDVTGNVTKYCTPGIYYDFNLQKCVKCEMGYFSKNYTQICKPCPIGFITDKPEMTQCKKCKPGTVTNFEGSFYCIDCSMGKYSSDSTIPCKKCKKGRYNNIMGNTKCYDCKPGTFSDQEGSKLCTNCQKGFYNPYFKSTNCSKYHCDPGFSSDIRSSSKSNCYPCKVGEYSNEITQYQCLKCDKGYFSNKTGSNFCYECDLGYYSNEIGSKNCKKCSRGHYSDTTKSTSCKKCGFNQYQPFQGGKECFDCPQGYVSSEDHIDCHLPTNALLDILWVVLIVIILICPFFIIFILSIVILLIMILIDKYKKNNKKDYVVMEKFKRKSINHQKNYYSISEHNDENDQFYQNDRNECCTCIVRKKNILFKPCNHISCCEVCSNLLQKCPICRAKIIQKEKVYL